MGFESDEARRAYNRERQAAWRKQNPDRAKAASASNSKRERENRVKARQLDEMMASTQAKADSRSYRGSHPKGYPWHEVMSVVQGSGKSFWSAYIARRGEDEWFSVKVCVHGKRKCKANFWLRWNGDRLAQSRDMRLLQAHEPRLVESLLHYLRPEGKSSAVERLSHGMLDVAMGDTLEAEGGEE